MSKKGECNIYPRSHFQGGDSHRKIITTSEVVCKSAGSEPHNRLFRPRVLHWKDKSSKHLELESSGACIWESKRATE